MLYFVVLCQFLDSSHAIAGKVDFGFGFFGISAKTARSQGSLSNVGAYMVQYRHPFGSKLEVGLGYSVLMSKGIGGELAFGPDIGIYYFPLTRNNSLEMDEFATRMSWSEVWKPYLSVCFAQKQFQSVQTTYAGIGFTVGTERSLDSSVNVFGQASYRTMSGNSGATATEFSVLGGASIYVRYFE